MCNLYYTLIDDVLTFFAGLYNTAIDLNLVCIQY